MRKGPWVVCALVAVCLMVTPGLAGESRDVASLLGPDTLVLMAIEDVEAYGAKIKGTPSGRLWADDRVQEFIEVPRTKLRETWEGFRTSLVETYGLPPTLTLEKVGQTLVGQFAVAIERPFDGTFEASKDLSVLCVAEVGDEEELRGLLEKTLQSLGERVLVKTKTHIGSEVTGVLLSDYIDEKGDLRRNPFNYAFCDGYVIFGNRLSGVQNVIEAIRGERVQTLLDSSSYQALLERSGSSPDTLSYVNVAGIVDALPERLTDQLNADPDAARADTGPTAMPPALAEAEAGGDIQVPDAAANEPAPFQKIVEMLDTLGLSSIEALGSWGRIEPDGTQYGGAYIHAPGQRKGLLKLMAGSPSPMAPPAYLPSETLLYEAFRIGPDAMYKFAHELAESMSPADAEGMEAALDNLAAEDGLDLRAGLFEALGDEVAFVLLPPGESPALPADMPLKMAAAMQNLRTARMILVALPVRDATALEGFLNAAIERAQEEPKVAVETEVGPGYTLYTLQPQGPGGMPAGPGPMPTPCCALTAGYLFLGFSADTVKGVLSPDAPPARFADEPGCRKALAALPEGDSVGLVCMNDARYMAWNFSNMRQSLELMRMQLDRVMEAGQAGPPGMAPPETGAPTPVPPTAPDMGGPGPGGPEGIGPPEMRSGPQPPLMLFLSVFDQAFDMIDMSLWPGEDVFLDHLGYSAVKVRAVPDGLVLDGVTVPKE